MNPSVAILKIQIQEEQDVVLARQRARQIATLFKFAEQDQIRIATAVSELARNCFQYVGKGSVEFSLVTSTDRQSLTVAIKDQGPGIPNLQEIMRGQYTSKTGMGVGLVGAKKMMDEFSISSGPGQGTAITIAKYIPKQHQLRQTHEISKIVDSLKLQKSPALLEEMKQQNLELLQALEEVRLKQEELMHLNQELSETNRGVVALYAELDEKAASLQRANEVKTSFLSNMTHEFRTPLTSIMSLSRLLLDRLDGDLTTEQEKQVRYIRQSAEGLLELVNDLLDLAKVEAGKIAIKVSDFDLGYLFGAIRGVFRPLIPTLAPVSLEFEIEEDLKVHSDEAKVSQVLRNLISNALKYTESGRVIVRAQVDDSGYLLISVQDTGIGIAPEHQELIFKDFTQIDSSLQRQARGTGLGLPLSRKLAHLLGGTLWVESEVGKGSTFYFKIPRVFEGDQEGILVHESAPSVKKDSAFRCLIVDSDEPSRYVLKSILSSVVPTVFVECSTAKDALRKALEFTPDALFMDCTLPDSSGFELIRKLKSYDQLDSVPIFINTARILTKDEEDVLAQLTNGLISKNSEDHEKELLRVLQEAGFVSPKQPTNPQIREVRA